MKKLSFSMRNRGGFVVGIFLVSLVFAYSQMIPENGHGGEDVYVFINGKNLALQDAIYDGEFAIDYSGGASYFGDVNGGHTLEEVMVSLGGNMKSFQAAIDDDSLCKFSGGAGDSFGNIFLGHSSDEILVDTDGEKTLQDAIDAGDFFYSTWLPNTDTKCHDETLSQTNCGDSRVVSGTKCCDRTWSPATNTVCSGSGFTQTSNCGTTRSSVGTKCCDTSWSPSTSTVCSGTRFTQSSNCGTTRSSVGTKCCDTSWSPATSTVCSGTGFTQTSNCGTTRGATGTKTCADCRYFYDDAFSSSNFYWSEIETTWVDKSPNFGCFSGMNFGGHWESKSVFWDMDSFSVNTAGAQMLNLGDSLIFEPGCASGKSHWIKMSASSLSGITSYSSSCLGYRYYRGDYARTVNKNSINQCFDTFTTQKFYKACRVPL